MEEKLQLTDLVDVETLQRIQDAFSNMTGIAALTTDADGIAVTRGSNFSDFCMKYTRSTELGCSRCKECDKEGAARALRRGRSITYFCHAGLVDFAAPIMANDEMIGCFIGGQVLVGKPEEDYVRKIAGELGVDPDDYVEAAEKVTIVPKEKIESAAEFLYTIANVISDITYSRYLSRKASREIERAANMKSDFLANMSHEIRTPMNAVIGMAEMALREELSENAREYINEIKASSKSLLTIINDILDFSKIESGKMDIVPGEYEPMSIVNDVTNIVMTRLEDKDVELILDIDPNIPHKLYGDCDRIKQIILNLMNNAVKFTNKGQVVFRLGFEKQSEDHIILKGAVEDTGIGIKDEDLHKLFQSFQQLDSKRNRNIEGTGLGLAICKQLLGLMEGSIKVESVYEKGSIFSFGLPQKVLDNRASIYVKEDREIVVAGLLANKYVKRGLAASAKRLGAKYFEIQEEEITSLYEEEASYLFVESARLTDRVRNFVETNPQITSVLITNASENIGRDIKNIRIVKKPLYTLNLAMIFNNESIHYDYFEQNMESFDFIAPEAEILIVDDNAINLTVAEGLLEPLRMKVDTATSGKEAVEKISNHMYDIIFMDHMMPEIDGVETTHIIRRFHKEYDAVPIIALTANAVGGTMEMFLKEGMNDFVAKPIEIRILTSKVKRWLPAEKIQKTRVTKKDSSANQAANTLPPIGDLDVDSAFRLLGTEKLFWSVLKDYYRVIEQKAAHIREMVRTENWTAYTIEVHALKSASKQIGAHSLSEKAARLEQAGNERNIELIRASTEEMLQQYCDYIPVFRPFFEENKADVIKIEITGELLREFFGQLRTAMDNLDIDTMEEIMNQMEQYSYPEEQSLYKQLQEAVENIDVDNCEAIICQWEKFTYILTKNPFSFGQKADIIIT